MSSGAKSCIRCGSRLARDNTGELCGPCDRGRERLPRLEPSQWRTEAMRQALLTREFGTVLRAWRRHPSHGGRPVPQIELARWLGITQGQLSRIESGRHRVRDLDKLNWYARTLGIPAELLWFELDGSDPAPPVTRDPALDNGALVAAAAPVPADLLVDSFSTVLEQYVRTDRVAGAHRLIPIITQQMRYVEQLDGTGGGSVRTGLPLLRARFAEFLGWLYQDAGNLATAREWTGRAATLAGECGDERLRSYTLVRQSNIAAESGNPAIAIELARAALRNSAEQPRLRTLALLQLAHGHALRKEGSESDRAIGQAWEATADSASGDGDLAGYCTPEFIRMEAANSWVHLGRPDAAVETLLKALPLWQIEDRRDLGRGLALLAVAQARTGQADQALEAARHALVIASETHSSRTLRQLHRLPEELTGSGGADQARELRTILHRTLRT
ncbi:helix-turn-helix domain-containing protein [Nocardia sp. NPDC005825]|uniref:helix-turn-helix domain-containing protein n=1 Tax=unclassified Nocardia TaxID=2637762 RepID=UPI0033D84B52